MKSADPKLQCAAKIQLLQTTFGQADLFRVCSDESWEEKMASQYGKTLFLNPRAHAHAIFIPNDSCVLHARYSGSAWDY